MCQAPFIHDVKDLFFWKGKTHWSLLRAEPALVGFIVRGGAEGTASAYSPWIMNSTKPARVCGCNFVWSWQKPLLHRPGLPCAPHGFAVIAP